MNNMHIQRFSSEKGKTLDVCLMLHGFPAAVFSEPSFEKNHDIGLYVSRNTKMDVCLPHYEGLGKSRGSFSFIKSIEDAIRIGHKLITVDGYRRIHLLGHSWGGFVAMSVLKALAGNVGKVVLLSPFTEVPDAGSLKCLLESICSNVDITFESGSIDDAVYELIQVGQCQSPNAIAQVCTSNDIMIIQAKDDDEVPAQSTRRFVEMFKVRPQYVELDSDHRFMLNREYVKQLIVDHINGEW